MSASNSKTSEPAKEAWSPAVGDRVRVRSAPDDRTHPEWAGLPVGSVTEITLLTTYMGKPIAYVNPKEWAYLSDLEPAPSSAKPESPAVKGIDPAFDATPEFKEACRVFNKQNGPRKWDTDRHHGIVDSDLDTRIAAARAEMDRPAVVRFPHEGRNSRVYRSNDR